MAVVDYFLKLDGVEGESQDEKFKGSIDLESWSWCQNQSGTHGGGGGGGAGKVQMQDFHFVMNYNKASPTLFMKCASGQHIPSAVLTCRKAGGKQEIYLTVKMTDLLVSAYQTGGSTNGSIVPTDQISVNFAKIEFDYKEQKADGTMVNAGKAGWDLKKNVKI